VVETKNPPPGSLLAVGLETFSSWLVVSPRARSDGSAHNSRGSRLRGLRRWGDVPLRGCCQHRRKEYHAAPFFPQLNNCFIPFAVPGCVPPPAQPVPAPFDPLLRPWKGFVCHLSCEETNPVAFNPCSHWRDSRRDNRQPFLLRMVPAAFVSGTFID
jgi:hypothetical protein